MTLRAKFITFAVFIHLVLIAVSLPLLALNKYLFAIAELLILAGVAVTIHLYKSFLKPLNLLSVIVGRSWGTAWGRPPPL